MSRSGNQETLLRDDEMPEDDLVPVKQCQEFIKNELLSLRKEVKEIALQGKSVQSSRVEVASSSSSEAVVPDEQCKGICPKMDAVIARIETLENNWSMLESIVTRVDNRRISADQHGRLWNLILDNVANVPYKLKGWKFSQYIVWLLNSLYGQYLPFRITLLHIDVSHPLYKKPNGNHVLIVRFVHRDVRDAIWYRSVSVGHPVSGVSVRENLTEENRILFKAAEKCFGFRKVFTDQCKIFTLVRGSKKFITCQSDIDALSLNNSYCNSIVSDSTVNLPPDNVIQTQPPPPGTVDVSIPPNDDFSFEAIARATVRHEQSSNGPPPIDQSKPPFKKDRFHNKKQKYKQTGIGNDRRGWRY